MSTRILIAVSDDDLFRELGTVLMEGSDLEIVGRAVDSAGVVDALRRIDVDVLILQAELGPLAIVELARSVAASFPYLGMVFTAASSSADTMRLAVECGARGMINRPVSIEELEAAVGAASKWSRSVREYAANPSLNLMPTRGGVVVAVAGGKGGVGTTTLAVHLALAANNFSKTKGGPARRVCLADLSVGGDVRLVLDVTARRDITDLAHIGRDLSIKHLDEALYQHPVGMHVLLAAEHAEHANEVDTAAARAVLGALAARHDVVVVDVGTGTTEAALVAVDLADEVLIVTTPDVIAIRAANRLQALWERVEARQGDAKLIVNRASKRSEVQPELVRKAYSGPVSDVVIPSNFKALETVVNAGVPERLTNSGLSRAFLAVAQEAGLLETRPQDRGTAEGEEEDTGGAMPWYRRLGPQATGTAAVEAAAVTVFLILLLAFAVQGIMAGYTLILAGDSASRAAHELSLQADAPDAISEAALVSLPDRWKDDMEVTIGEQGGMVAATVALQVPVIMPGLNNFADGLTVKATRAAVPEPVGGP